MKKDAARIKRLGGPAQLAKILGFKEPGGTQRVHNWTKRGIPAEIKLNWPDLFLTDLPAPKRARRKAVAVEV